MTAETALRAFEGRVSCAAMRGMLMIGGIVLAIAVGGCGGSDSTDSAPAVSESKAEALLAAQTKAAQTNCVRNEGSARKFECNVEPGIWNPATALVRITVSASADSVVITDCEPLKQEAKYREVEGNPCARIR